MKASELREQFLRYFEGQGHTRVPSASLVPLDPTLFFTNAGMVQFKGVFVGEETRSYTRACSSQKCMRVSGKHNDLENVGRTPRHHTFFEMLGNFSFGDYFKKEAIAYAWELLTKGYGLPNDRLVVTVFRDDDDAAKLWTAHLPKDRIFRLGEEDNFWAMGETGPCGPCSEILYDWSPSKKKIATADIISDRFWEVWKPVFMQFNRDAKGKRTPLAKPSIDTGMGLERIAAIIQGKESNYDTDLFTAIIRKIEEVTGTKYGGRFNGPPHPPPHPRRTSGPLPQGGEGRSARDRRPATGGHDVSIRVIADHIRGTAMLIADGVQPSNEGRGYVLRRIMRRAIRHGKMLGMDRPFFAPLAHVVIDELGPAYPELVTHRAFIEETIRHEEERFYETLERGLGILTEAFAALPKGHAPVVPDELVFRLYDTYGFPKDLTADIAAEKGFTIDDAGFEALMDAQRQKARAAWKGTGDEGVAPTYATLHQEGVKNRFVGYTETSAAGRVAAILIKGRRMNEARAGETIELVTDVTPFYGEGGGQVGDTGSAVTDGLEIEISDTKKPYPTLFVHHARVVKGTVREGQSLTLAIDAVRRDHIRRNHTATHLLHKALREVLGEHVKQAGSLVAPERLRFDFSHHGAMTREEIAQIEEDVNRVIYGSVVRVVEVPGYSMELCGGTHVRATGDIGMCKIVSQGSVAAGVRRIEAVTGQGVERHLQQLEQERHELADTLKVGPQELVARVKKLAEQIKTLERELTQARLRGATAGGDPKAQIKEVSGIKVLATTVEISSPAELRALADQWRLKLGSGIVALGAAAEGKATVIVMVSKDLTDRFQANRLIQPLAKAVGGTGGGRPDMAQGGGPAVEALPVAMATFSEIVGR
ncbi:MAG: alanine--tRNA ligase [Deltaproteobacteria bacterium]|nr:alanine--tRNA ligase [Deltaproteobacteria bacterium]